jgi:hypothetical protein
LPHHLGLLHLLLVHLLLAHLHLARLVLVHLLLARLVLVHLLLALALVLLLQGNVWGKVRGGRDARWQCVLCGLRRYGERCEGCEGCEGCRCARAAATGYVEERARVAAQAKPALPVPAVRRGGHGRSFIVLPRKKKNQGIRVLPFCAHRRHQHQMQMQAPDADAGTRCRRASRIDCLGRPLLGPALARTCPCSDLHLFGPALARTCPCSDLCRFTPA